MPRSKTSLRQPCASCGGKIDCSEADARCHGCGLIICAVCTEDCDHIGYFGTHGLKQPSSKFAALRAEGLRERDRRLSETWKLTRELDGSSSASGEPIE